MEHHIQQLGNLLGKGLISSTFYGIVFSSLFIMARRSLGVTKKIVWGESLIWPDENSESGQDGDPIWMTLLTATVLVVLAIPAWHYLK